MQKAFYLRDVLMHLVQYFDILCHAKTVCTPDNNMFVKKNDHFFISSLL